MLDGASPTQNHKNCLDVFVPPESDTIGVLTSHKGRIACVRSRVLPLGQVLTWLCSVCFGESQGVRSGGAGAPSRHE